MIRFDRWILRLARGLVFGLGMLQAAHAAYPDKPIRLLVPYAAGGAGDIVARLVAQKMSAALGQQIVVDNRPSAGGIVATEIVARAEPDGYTLLLLNNGHAVSQSLFRSLPYSITEDFAPVSTISSVSLALLVNSDSPIRTVQDFVRESQANPARFNVGTTAIGSTPNLAAELFRATANPRLTIVPFNGTPAVINALKSGEIQAAFEFITPVLGQLKAGGLRAVAVTSSARVAVLPEVPTVSERGGPNYEASSWNGIAVPAKTPQAIVDRLHQEVTAAVADPGVKARLLELGAEPSVLPPVAVRRLLAAEIAKWAAVIEQAKIPRN